MGATRVSRIIRTVYLIAVGLGVAALGSVQSRAADLTTLVSFCAQTNCTGMNIIWTLNTDADGNLFGTTKVGGAMNAGTVFEVEKTAEGYASTPTILYSFCAQTNCTDGSTPLTTLVADADDNLFGTAVFGGAHGDPNNGGVVFELANTAAGYSFIPLVSFCLQAGCTDGALPNGLVADIDGNLFGTTQQGGANGSGTVFEIEKTATGYASTPTILYSFCAQTNCADGSRPEWGVIIDRNGNLFGTTRFGGANGSGTVFEIANTASGYSFSTLVTFGAECAGGGCSFGGLVADAVDNLFGITIFMGAPQGSSGKVFEVAKTATGFASTPTILYSFCAQTNCADGDGPNNLMVDTVGNLFGTTIRGGANGQGTAFELAKTGSGYASSPAILHSFCAQTNCGDGAAPNLGLAADNGGHLFGTTFSGGANNGGTVFEVGGGGFIGSFIGTPGSHNCRGKTVSALEQRFGTLDAAATALRFPDGDALQNAIADFCAG